MTLGDFHAFPEGVAAFEDAGTVTETITRSGQYWKLSIPGSYQGQNGAFEFIKDVNGVINHRFFNPNP